jgi:hypothetical protein
MSASVRRPTMFGTRVGSITLDHGLAASEEDVQRVFDASDFQRACQAYLWALPIVGLAQWQHAARTCLQMRDVDLVIYESAADQGGILTADVSVPYLVGLPDLARTGPLVVEYPAGNSAGTMYDFWQRPLQRMGEGGHDSGAGGTYLVVGPGQLPHRDAFDFVVHSPTFNLLLDVRPLDADPARANSLVDRFRMYPVGQAAHDEATCIIRPEGRRWSQVPPRGLEYWARLAEILQRETITEQDLVMLALLQTLGIERGHAFMPDERQRALLEDGAAMGELMARTTAFDGRDATTRYRTDARWRVVQPNALANGQRPDNLVDARTDAFYKGVAASTGARPRGEASPVCLLAHRDSAGNALDGSRTYRLRVPPHPPAKTFWSLTVYDADQRVLMQSGRSSAQRSSRESLRYHFDGSVTLYVGPKAPGGWEHNWIATAPTAPWFAYFRLFAPLAEYFARRFALPDFECVDADP